jgi:hypothetical protein
MIPSTIEPKIAKAEDSRSVRDDGDFKIIRGMVLKDLVDVAFILQTDI